MSAYVEIIFDNTDNRIPVSHYMAVFYHISLFIGFLQIIFSQSVPVVRHVHSE